MEKRVIWRKMHNSTAFYSADLTNWIDSPKIWFDDFDSCKIKTYPDDLCAK